MQFYIVDDDPVSRRMLQTIIENRGLGEVSGTADSGLEGIVHMIQKRPDVVLIDLLMPDQDGIETILQLKERAFKGKFVMISQVVNKEMVEQAYQAGIEFFIHKPINKVEVEAVLRRVEEQLKLDRSLLEIRRSLSALEQSLPAARTTVTKERMVRDVVNHILMDMGISGESGSKDIIAIMEYLADHKEHELPPLKDLYEVAANKYRLVGSDAMKECKAIEQRIRRTVMAALSNLASIGLTDYSNPKFEHYAPLYFDFQDVRIKMKEMDRQQQSGKGKINIKKFLQSLYLELLYKLKE